MKAKIFFILLYTGFLIVGCSDKNEFLNQPPPNNGTNDCLYCMGFIETYRYCIEYDGIFFVKGKVTASGQYGINIKILEDLKGNFSGNTSFTLWNHWDLGISDLNYAVNDIILILMKKIGDDSDDSGGYDPWTKERIGDFCTISCSNSTLLSLNEKVTGVINSDYKKITIPWNELKLVLTACQTKLEFVDNYRANINREDVFYIKGKVLEKPNSYGLKIKLDEDLKGNFSKDSTIIVWGSGDASNCIDRLRWYYTGYENCSLLMLIKPIISVEEPNSQRNKGDYSTMECAYSVLMIVDERVEIEWNKWVTWEEYEALLH